jgi:hypothetical protein
MLDRRLDDPLADLADQPAILRHGQEVARRRIASIRQPPAQQRFHDAGLAGREVDLGLEVQLELAALDRAAQSLLGGKACGSSLEKLRTEHPDPAAPLRLRVEQGGVRGPQQHFRLVAVGREDACAQAHAHQEFAAIDEERVLESHHDPRGHPLDVLLA